MELTTGQYIQLIVGVFAVTLLFSLAYAAPEKWIIGFLAIMVPFQPIVSKYGTVNTGMALIVMLAFLFNRRVTRLPLISIVLMALFVYLVSTVLAHKQTYMDHIYYLIAIAANVSLFYILYNYIVRSENIRGMVNIIIGMNALVIVYSVLQMGLGLGGGSMGVGELSLLANRADARLVGPFNAVGITAEFMVIQIFIVLYVYFNTEDFRTRLILLGLIAGNMAILVGTGNRTGLGVLILFSGVFFLLFRRDFGTARILKLGGVGAALFVVMATLMVVFTDFNVLFERLSETQIGEEGLPDSRTVIWPLAAERIQEEPMLGHGPRIRLIEEVNRRIPGHEFMPYPHSLYLYVPYTIGFVGLFVLALAFFGLLRIFVKAMHNQHPDAFVRGMPKLALLVLLVIAVDQIKVAMMRFALSDYQQYVAVLLGLFVGAAYVARSYRAEPEKPFDLTKQDRRQVLVERK